MQKWIKKGLIFTPKKSELMYTHCQHATPIKISDNKYRVFFGSRNPNNFTQTFYFDIDLSTQKVVNYEKNPVLKIGDLGRFDQHGIYPSSIIKFKDSFYLYTIGYTQGKAPLYHTSIGLATSNNMLNFEKLSKGPILGISEYDPCSVTGPYIIEDNGILRMWYVSTFKWTFENSTYQSHYHIKYAESKDGINWNREGKVAIEHCHPGETNIARPWIIKEDGIYKAWYSYCCGSSGYRIGYAESKDGGYTFERMDHLAGIHPSDEPWENEAIAYPSVVVHKGRKYMFYNGNKFGKDGIALAVEE